MRILFYRYGSICEPDLIEEFKKIGFEVDCIQDEIVKKGISSSERIDLISKALKAQKYVFVFGINFYPSISDVCQIYKIPYVTWIVDAPLMELFSSSIQNSYNKIFCFDRTQFLQIHDYNPDCIFYLPLATNVSRWDREVNAISEADIKKYASDISFIGSLYTEKDPYLEAKGISDFARGYIDAICTAQEQIIGSNIIKTSLTNELVEELKKALPNYFCFTLKTVCNTDTFTVAHQILDMHCSSLERIHTLNALSKHFKVDLYTASNTDCFKGNPNISLKGTAKTLTEMPRIFNLSKINLNITIHSIETGASLRIWDVLGCRGFLMSNYQEELLEYLEPGVDFDFYTSVDDLIEKCDFYLTHEDIRRNIAASGYEKVKSFHTYTNRMPNIISTIM